jgi:formate dehydrogenase maturation protein FdhE
MKSGKFTSNAFLLLALLFVAPFAFSQEDNAEETQSRRETIEQLKIAFITKELDLTADQAEKFWPVYNEMSKKINEENKSRKKTAEDLRQNLETLSEEDIKTKTNSVLDNDIKAAQLKKDYNEKIAAIIGYKKATKLLSLEARFKRELLSKLKEQPQNSNNPQPHPRKPGPKRTN